MLTVVGVIALSSKQRKLINNSVVRFTLSDMQNKKQVIARILTLLNYNI